MTCGEIDLLLDGYLNGDIEPGRSMEIEEHIAHCSRCSRMQEDLMALRTALRSEALYHRMPLRASARLRKAVRKEMRPRFIPFGEPWRIPAFASLAVFLLALAIWKSGIVSFPSAGANTMADAVVDSHIRSLLVNHLTDVTSTDQHTVKPWFDGKIDYSPDVVNLDAKGFILLGGRLDYLGHRVVSVVAYRRRQHIINLYSWPTSETDPPAHESSTSRQGYHVKTWQRSGMTYWAVSDVSTDDLDAFVRLLQ
jgi:anti-sigma factor RsiW